MYHHGMKKIRYLNLKNIMNRPRKLTLIQKIGIALQDCYWPPSKPSHKISALIHMEIPKEERMVEEQKMDSNV